MDAHIRKVYVPMTETGFYILYCLQEEMHGYNIGLRVKVMTCGEVTISPGTMYGTLSKMEKDGLISFLREEDKRKIYQITDLGRDVLNLELARIERLYKNSKINKKIEDEKVDKLFMALMFIIICINIYNTYKFAVAL